MNKATDDAAYRRFDHTGTGVFTDSFYQLTDSSFSVIAHYSKTGVRQRISYDAFGNPLVLMPGDFDGDGKVTTADMDAFTTAYAAGSPAADFWGDGTVNTKDQDGFYAAWNAEISGTTLPDEVRIGYGGYVHDPVTGYSLARQRWYDPIMGRWITRDPAGYVDGLSLYLYAKGNPRGWWTRRHVDRESDAQCRQPPNPQRIRARGKDAHFAKHDRGLFGAGVKV